MHKTPNRPKHDITQPLNDGVVDVYAVADIAQAGYSPVEKLTKKITLRYAEMRLGINRIYQSRQAQVNIERVIRVQAVGDISTQDVAMLSGRQYKIDTVQKADVYPPCVDLSLVRIEQNYEVME